MRNIKQFYIILGLLLWSIQVTVLLAQGQGILQHKLDDKVLDAIVSDIQTWRAQKSETWKQTIAELPEAEQHNILKTAEEANAFAWPSLLASQYMEYKLNGNRTNYERVVNKRRDMLSRLVLGELVEKERRFIPQIANGLWLMLEESTWVSPAHIVVQKSGAGLPDPTDSYIDLGAGRVAADLATVYLLLKEDLDGFSPQISKKLYKELEKRILIPYLERDDFWWMNLKKGTLVNNWNIWINTNVLKTALLVDADGERLKKVLHKIMQSADKFVDYYPEDGACEEGPSYWGHAAGELGQMLYWLTDVSKGGVSFAGEEKMRRMGEYILNTHITQNRFLNFADAEAIQIPYPTKVWTFGELFGDERLKSFAVYLNRLRSKTLPLGSVQDFLLAATAYPALTDKREIDVMKPQDHYYESLQMATLRSLHPKGDLFFAAIGGHNGVSHNHNDVGSFMLYLDTMPIFIDAGVGTYTRETFSARRYSLWNMQSQWHNLPIINGVQQKDGKSFKARNVKLTKQRNAYTYEVDISEAYPEEAQVKSWKRSFDFLPKTNRLRITEHFELSEWKQASEIVLLTPIRPIVKKAAVYLPLADGRQVIVAFDESQLALGIEDKILEDPRIARVWGKQLYRIKLMTKEKDRKGSVRYNVSIRETR